MAFIIFEKTNYDFGKTVEELWQSASVENDVKLLKIPVDRCPTVEIDGSTVVLDDIKVTHTMLKSYVTKGQGKGKYSRMEPDYYHFDIKSSSHRITLGMVMDTMSARGINISFGRQLKKREQN